MDKLFHIIHMSKNEKKQKEFDKYCVYNSHFITKLYTSYLQIVDNLCVKHNIYEIL